MALADEKQFLFCLVALHYTFYDVAVICLSEKHSICRFFRDPVHYDASHGILVEASDCSAIIPRNIMTPLGPLRTLYELPLLFVGLPMSELCIGY